MTFQRELRYYILKMTDIDSHLVDSEKAALQCIANRISFGRASQGKSELYTAVVESDWPEYEITWKMIQDRIEGRPNELTQLRTENAELRKSLLECRGSVALDLRHYEKLTRAYGNLGLEGFEKHAIAEAEAQRLHKLIDTIDAAITKENVE